MSDPKRKFVPFDELVARDSAPAAARPAYVPFDELVAAPSQSHVIEMPVQQIEGDVPDDRPWYAKLKDAMAPTGKDLNGFPTMTSERGIANIRTGAPAAVAGATHGLTSGLADDAAGIVSPDAAEAVRGYWKHQQAAEPGPFNVGDTAGMLAQPGLVSLHAAGPVAKVVAKAAEGAINTGASVAARDFGDSENPDTLERGKHALQAAEIPAAVGGGVPLVASGLSTWAASKAKDLESAANINRVAATGTYGAQLRNMAQNKGEDYVQNLGRDIEAAGLHKGKGLLGFLPQPADTYLQNAQALNRESGVGMGQAEDAIVKQGNPQVPISGISSDLRNQAATHASYVDPAGDTQAAFMRKYADRFDAPETVPMGDATATTTRDSMPFDEALANRRYIDSQIDWGKRGGYEGAGMQEQVRRGVAGDLRAGIKDTLRGAADSGEIDPALVEDWKTHNDNYALSAAVQEPGLGRMYQEYGNQKIGLPGYLSAAAGAAAGGPLGAVGGAMLGQAAKFRGTSALTGAQRAGQHTLETAAPAMAELGDSAPWFARLKALRDAEEQRRLEEERLRGGAEGAF